MNELNYGVNVENLLYVLSQHESGDIGEFEFYGEDEQGREGSATIDITMLAADAVKLIATLKAERDALAAELSVVEVIHDECSFVTDDDYEACPEKVQKIIRNLAVMQIPATDAYLNSVRAEGVEALTKILQAMIDAGDFAGDEIGAIAGAVDAGNYHAAKLRAGEPS